MDCRDRIIPVSVFGMLAAWLLSGVALGAAEAPKVPEIRPVTVAESAPWFDTIALPLPLAEAVGGRVAAELYAALRAGKVNGAEFLTFLPPDNAPRVIMLSWRSPKVGPRTVTGAGRGLRAAAADALNQARELPDSRRADGLKVDIVQHTVVNTDFELRTDPLPHPSLAGIAFSKASGFAFLPEALVAEGLVTSQRKLDFHRIAERLLAEGDMTRLGHWQSITSWRGQQAVTFFETQAYYADGKTSTLLFRGHRLIDPLNEETLRAAARRNAAFLRRCIRADGSFVCELPGWQTGDDGSEPVPAFTLALLALLDWQELDPSADTLAAAGKGIHYLLTLLKPFKPDAQAACVVEDYHSLLGTNALAVLALAKYGSVTHKDEYSDHLNRLGRYLLDQIQPDGSLVCERTYPSATARGTVSLAAQAQAVVAFARLYEKTGRREYLDAATRTVGYLVQDQLARKEIEQLPPDGWLLMALDETFTFTRDPECVRQAERLASAIYMFQTLDPVFPDCLGAWGNSPVLAAAAPRTLGLLAAAKLCRDTRRELMAEKALAAAHLGLIFQLQGQFDTPATLYLRDADPYLGAFRDDLTGCGLRLETQAESLFCLTSAVRVSVRLAGKPLPLTEPLKTALTTARTQVVTFPRCLPRLIE